MTFNPILRIAACIFTVALIIATEKREVLAQTSGSTTPRLTMQGGADPSNSPIARDALGRPCLDVEAAARAHIVNSSLIDHVVSVKNNCSRMIKIKVCYTNSERCTDAAIGSYGRSDVILGTMTGVKIFRYSILQK